jgi:DNA-binding transcriptional MerR regulator
VKGLSISDVVERTGVAEGTLRMWERRHGFPVPERRPSGHRRYSEEQVERVLRVVAGRAAGLSLTAAIDRAQRETDSPATSLFAAIRRRRPDIEPRTITKHVLAALSHAIEDESLSRAERPVLFASFQQTRFYDEERGRFQELSRGAAMAVVFADFDQARVPPDGPTEIPVDRTHPLTREWAVVCDADHHAVCLAGWERPGPETGAARLFETLWSVEPQVVRDASRISAAIAAEFRPDVIDPVRGRLEAEPTAASDEQLRLATAITNRALSYLC